jgi:hypothetical protein
MRAFVRNRLGGFAGDERGFVMGLLVMILALALMLLAVAATQAIRTTDTANRDRYSRQAVQAAEAGLDTAVYRADALSVDLRTVLNVSNQCVAETGGLLTFLNVGGWCPVVDEDLGNDISYSYRVSPVTHVAVPPTCPLLALVTCTVNHTLRRTVVSTGMAGPGCPNGSSCVKRRLMAKYTTSAQTTTLLPLLGLRILQNLSLQLYQRQTSSFTECSKAAAAGADPDNGC